MRWCQLKLGVLLLAAGCIFSTKAVRVVDEPNVVTDSINEADEIFLGAEEASKIAEPSLKIFNDSDEVTEDKDDFQRSIYLPYGPVSDTAYWDSIYGTDGIPEFDTPPEIEGDSITLKTIDEDVDEVDDVAFPFIKRSTDTRNLGSVESDRETVDHRWNVNGKRSNSKGQSYRDDRTYWRNPLLPRYNEDQENPRFARQFESYSMIANPEINFSNDFSLRDSEDTQIIRQSNRPMRTIPIGIYTHHTKYVPWLNVPETHRARTSTKVFAGSSRNNGGLSIADGIAEKSDGYAKSEASSSGIFISSGPGTSSGTNPVIGSSNYYISDDSDSSQVIGSSMTSAISGENEKSISNFEYRRNVHFRPKHGMAHSHGVNSHKLSVNHPGCGCSNKMIIGDQGALIVSDKKNNIKQVIDSQSTSSNAHASTSSQVNLNEAVTGSTYSDVEENLEIGAGQLNDLSLSQTSVGAITVDEEKSQTGIGRKIATQETVSQSVHERERASAASEHHESISALVTDQSQVSSVNKGSVIPFIKDSIDLGSSVATGAASTVVTNILDRTSSQTIGTKQNVPSSSPCQTDVISGSELSTARSRASAIAESDKIMNSNEEVAGSTTQSTAYTVNDVRSGMINEESFINSATTNSQVVQEHQESIQSAAASSQFEGAGQTIVNSEAAETGSGAGHVIGSSAHAAGSVLVKTRPTFVTATLAPVGSPRTVVAPHSVAVNAVPDVGAAVILTNSAVSSLANVAQHIIRAKEGVINNIVHVPEHVIVDSDLVRDGGCDLNPIDTIVGDVICEQTYPVNLPAHPGQYMSYDPRIRVATATNTFVGFNRRTGGQARTTLLTDKSVISSADASSRVSIAGSGAAVDSVEITNHVLSNNNLGSANVAKGIAQSSAVAASEASVGTSAHGETQASAAVVQTSETSVESTLTSSAHVATAERETVNDCACDNHSVNVDSGAILQRKGNTAVHSTVENVQQIHSSTKSQETHVTESLASSASASSQVVQEHNHPVHVSDVESCEDAGSINIQEKVFGASAAASATSSATTELAQSVVQNGEQVMTDRHSEIPSREHINVHQSGATALVQETVGSSAHTGSEVISANRGLAQASVEIGHEIASANSAITGIHACESSLNLADQAEIAGTNLDTEGHVIVNSNSGLANVHSHAVDSVSKVSSQLKKIKEEHIQSATHSVSGSVSSQSAASASASARSAIIDQSVSTSAGNVKGHTMQLDDDCDVDSADVLYLDHGLSHSQSQSRSQTLGSAHLINSNAQSSSQAAVSAKTKQVNVASAASASGQVFATTVGDVNQVAIGSQDVDADDRLSASSAVVQDADITLNSEIGIIKASTSSSATAGSSSSTIESSVNGVSSLSAQSNRGVSAKSAAGASVQNNVRMNLDSAHVHSASGSRGSISQFCKNSYSGGKVSSSNDHATRVYGYNHGRIPVQKEKVPTREIFFIENDSRIIKPLDTEDYGDECSDESKKADDDILESAIDKGSRLVERVINDAAVEYNMNEDTDFKEKIVDLAVKTVKKLVSDVASEAARKISHAEVAEADSELKMDKSSISNSGFDYVDTKIQECPWPGNWREMNLHDHESHRNRPHLHPNGYRYPRYNDNSNRFVAEQRGRYRNEKEIFPQDENKFERKFLDNLYFDGNIHHFQFTNENASPPEAHIDNNKLYNLNFYDNTRFIDLDVNCSDKSIYMTPECKRLDYSLKSPNEGNPIPLRFIKNHLSQGHDFAVGMHDRARWLVSGGFQPKPHTASMLHFLNNKVKDSIVKIHEESELTLFAAKLLQDRLSTEYNVTPNSFFEFLHNHGFRITGSGICQIRLKRCSSLEKYRSYDGSCNNFHHPRWGQANTAFTRVVPPRYSDGIHKVPVSVTGDELPNVRELSVQLFPHRNISNTDFTLALVQWGQVLSHDFAHQIMDQTIGGGIECCSSNGHGELPKSLQHHSCMPIIISSKDKFYSKYGQRCMNFVRSMTVSKDDCTLGPAEQLNGATSFLDCSPMYGSDKNTCDSLRVFHGGLMKTEIRRGRQMMPTTTDRSRYCDIISPSEVCYKGGDVRVNQNPHLVILQTLLVREHNRVAQELSKLNPHWSDEKIFQETRRIVIAEYQHITYHEWLPIVLGKQHCKKYGLISIEPRMSTDYNSRVNPAVINGFAAAAFRFFHSMVDGKLNLCPMDRSTTHTLRLSNHYFRPQIVERSNNFDDLVRGFITQPMMTSDRYFDSELTEYLFRSRNEYGLDLEALDIQRSRDHGLRGYNAYRKICQLKYAEDFDDLIGEISLEGIEELRNIYSHVDDIDLLVGGAMEKPIDGGILGPTIRCLVSEQFYRSRVSDRYFYDNVNFPHSFTEEQYQEIKKVSLARLICDTSDDLKVIQHHAFKTISWKNPLVSCCDIPKLNLTAWQE